MKISVGLPTGMEGLMYPVPFSTPKDIVDIAVHAERLGYHSVWGNDHMTPQHYVRAEFSIPPNVWEPLITYGFIAAATKTLRMGTGMLVLPMRRDIVVTAKQIATLDQFSGGRLEIGIGVGAYREEFEALQPHFKAHRGNMVDEGLQALRQLFTERSASHEGEYYQYRDVEMFPKPLQKQLPLYLGGNNRNAILRAAKAGDGRIHGCGQAGKLGDSTKPPPGQNKPPRVLAPPLAGRGGGLREPPVPVVGKRRLRADPRDTPPLPLDTHPPPGFNPK